MYHSLRIRSVSFLVFLYGCMFMASCVKEPSAEPADKPMFLVATSQNNSLIVEDILFFEYENGARLARIPFESRNERFKISVNLPDDTRLLVNGGKHQDPLLEIGANEVVNLVIAGPGSKEMSYRLQLLPDAGIPIFWIETEDGQSITSKDDYKDAMMSVDPGTGNAQEQREIALEIRGRGNSTWGMPKKPYRLRFKDKTAFMGFPATKNWVLLANYADKTQLRNYVAFELGHQMMDGFTPRTLFAEVYLNGEYQGLYHLTDQIRVEESRVDIAELDDTDEDPQVITGGYLLEIDERLDANHWFLSDVLGFPITFKSPEEPNTVQREYITAYIREFEEIIDAPDIGNRTTEYEQYIDVQSFIDYYLISEVMKNNDTGIGSSIYIHKPRDRKLKIGPLWDFDIAAGNINYHDNDDPTGWWIRPVNRWYARLFKDKSFEAAVKARWNEIKPTVLTDIMGKIDETAFGTLDKAQAHNFERWPILNEWVWPNAVVFGSYEEEVKYMKDWLNKRIVWMDNEIQQW